MEATIRGMVPPAGILILIACILVPAWSIHVLAATPVEPESPFTRYEVDLGPAPWQTVLTGNFLDNDMADIAVVDAGESGDRRLRIFTFEDDGWKPGIEASLRDEVLFVDVAGVGGRDRLLTYEHGRLNVLDPESATEHPLVEVISGFVASPVGEIPHVDVTRDVNGDGRDDLVVPASDGFRVFVQEEGGSFADPVLVGRSNDGAWMPLTAAHRYRPWDHGRVHEADFDGDRRSDLVYWDGDRFAVHHQTGRGTFTSAARTYPTEVSFDSDDLFTLVAPMGVRQRRMDHQPEGRLTGSVLHSLSDRNGDGVPDLVVFTLQGGSLWRMNSVYRVHFGAPSPDGTVFSPDSGAEIRSDGIPFGFGLHDLDRNGQADLATMVIDPGVFKAFGMIVGALLTGSVPLDLQVYHMDDGVFPDRPDAVRKVRSYPGGSGERTEFPTVLVGDVIGDGREDFVVKGSKKQLHVFAGVPGRDRFARRPLQIAVAMPGGEHTWLADLDGDGRRDILIQHPSTKESHRLTILIAR